MEQTWRWFGPDDPVSLRDIRQAGATAIVTALHHIANGEVWSVEEITARQRLLEVEGFRWSVVESVPVHEEIKTRSGNYQVWIDNYKQTLENLAQCGIDTVCYNFMPVVDWTRTDLDYQLADGSRALRFDHIAFAAFELCILQRESAREEYTAAEQEQALRFYAQLSNLERSTLANNIIAGLPGAEEGYTMDQFRSQLQRYATIDKHTLRSNLAFFLGEILPVCERRDIRLAIHPDDPPRPLLGLPRIVSTADDLAWLLKPVPSKATGLTMCTGSYGVRADNDLPRMIRKFSDRVYFVHLRSTRREENAKSFHEAAHLGGDVDMYDIVMALLEEEQKRISHGDNRPIPMRPDHGHQILDDLQKKVNPGYSAIGRLKGLAEIRGLEMAIRRHLCLAREAQ